MLLHQRRKQPFRPVPQKIAQGPAVAPKKKQVGFAYLQVLHTTLQDIEKICVARVCVTDVNLTQEIFLYWEVRPSEVGIKPTNSNLSNI